MSESISHPEKQPKKFDLVPVAKEELPVDVTKILPENGEFFYTSDADGQKIVVGLLIENERGTVIGIAVDVIDDKVAGQTEFMAASSERPYIYYTITKTEHQRKGMAEKRMMVLNQICKDRLHMPLSSSTTPSPAAKALWEKLVSSGFARTEVGKDGNTIYTLI